MEISKNLCCHSKECKTHHLEIKNINRKLLLNIVKSNYRHYKKSNHITEKQIFNNITQHGYYY